MKSCILLALFSALILCSSNCPAQQGAPPINPEPLERPRPLTVAEHADLRKVLEVVSTTLKSADFAIKTSDRKTFFIDARRFYDKQRTKDYDRVIVWLARSVATPEDVEVYLIYGRYVEIFGGTKRVERIVVRADEEEDYIGALKQRLTTNITEEQGVSR